MRKIYFLFYVFLISFGLQAQTIVNKAFHDYNDQAFQLIGCGSNFYFNSNIYTDGFQDSCLINGIDSLGNTLFRRVINKHEYTKINRIIETKDGNICFVGFANGCDFMDASQKTFIIKLDKLSGQTIFDNTFSNLDVNYQNDFLKDFIQYEDSTYFAITDSLLFHFSENGAIISVKNINVTGLTSIHKKEDGNLNLISNTQLKKWVIDTAANIISQNDINALINKTVFVDENRAYTLNKTISKRNNVMHVIATSTIAQDSIAGNIVTDFTITNDTIYACGYNLTSLISYVLLLDTNLNLIEMKTNATTRVAPTSIYYKNKITVLINSKSLHSSNGIIGIYSFKKHENYEFNQDVGVTKVIMDSGYVNPTTIFYPPTSSNFYLLSNRYYKVKVVVQNYGTGSVNQLQINQLLTMNSNCGYVYFTKHFDALNILPGTPDTLDLGWIHQLESSPPNVTLPEFLDLVVCFGTSIPNQEHDKNTNNDGACATILLPVVGLKENESVIRLNMYPNPTSDLISITTDALMLSATIYDVTGRKTEQLKLNNVKEREINMNSLEAGIYFIQVETSQGTVVRKIIKQ